MNRLLVFLLIATLATSAFAGTNYVWSGGNNTYPYGSWATAAHSIQTAINASSTNGRVRVGTGTYNITSPLMITNGVRVVCTSTVPATVNANGTSGCATVIDGGLIYGFTLTGGKSHFGAGLDMYRDGAAINCTLANNRGHSGGGAYLGNGSLLLHCNLISNRAYWGGGAFCSGSAAVLNSRFSWNAATNRGGGAYLAKNGAEVPFISDSAFEYNATLNEGGAVYINNDGAVHACNMTRNAASTNGGGVYARQGGSISDCYLTKNSAYEYGGAIYATGDVYITQSIIDDNEAVLGGGVYISGDCLVENCVVIRNSATTGAGIYSRHDGTVNACTIADNTASFLGGGMHCWSGVLTAKYSICYFNTAAGATQNYSGSISWSYSDAFPQPGGAFNLNQDPRFVNRAGGDYKLANNSPCIDLFPVGATTRDVTDGHRPLDGNNNGSPRYDCGAYEYVNKNADTDNDTFKDLFETARGSSPTAAWSLPYAYNDYNGDGLTDLAVHESSTSAWFIRSLGPVGPAYPAIAFAEIVGGGGTVPVSGRHTSWTNSDMAAYSASAGKWYLRRVGAGETTESIDWGGPGMVPVPGDYNGDGYFDLAMYEESTGNWYIRGTWSLTDPITFGQNWGGPGMIPVPGDYNGDGLWDMAVYQKSTGNWFIRPLGPYNPITFGQNWGGSAMWPVAGDFNADGLWDLAVYQWSTGHWYIRSLGPGAPIAFGQQWGGSGLTPVSGDYNGDGLSDLALYQQATGNWFIRSLGPVGPGYPPICFGQNWGGSTMKPVGGAW